MTTRRRVLGFVAVAGLLAAAAAGLAPEALAKGGGGGNGGDQGDRGDKGEGEDKEKKARRAVLAAVGAEFQRKDASALVARVPAKSKLRIRLGKNDGSYAPEQAKGVLADWFANFETIRVELKRVTELVGNFDLTVRRKGKDEEKPKTLIVTLRSSDPGYVLAALEEG